MEEYFSKTDNINIIIKKAIPKENIIKIDYISSGWTNFVYNVLTETSNYYFRFPRDSFWAKAIIKECTFAKYIKDKTDFKTPILNLKQDENGRYFSVHTKINGIPLADKMDKMSIKEIQKVTMQIANFMYQLHSIKIEKNKESINELDNIILYNFLDELLKKHVVKKDMNFWKDFYQNSYYCLVHGDLNASNILLTEDNNISGIIDWAFAGFGNKYDDISRIIGRCPDSFKSFLIKNYEKLDGKPIDKQELEKRVLMWKQIDNGYINYMKKSKQTKM